MIFSLYSSESSRGYITLLRQHIRKEDTHLFPMANEVIPVEKHASVWEDFQQVEIGEGVNEKYLTLVEALEQDLT